MSWSQIKDRMVNKQTIVPWQRVSKTRNASRIKYQQPGEIKGGDTQWGTFYHLEAALEVAKVFLWMLWRAGQGQNVIITLTPGPAGSGGLHRQAREDLSYM